MANEAPKEKTWLERVSMWRHAILVLSLIALMSLVGLQIYRAMPRPVVWALIAALAIAALLAAAFTYRGPIPRLALTAAIAGGVAALGIAVHFEYMTPAEIAHVFLFGWLGVTLRRLPPPTAIPLLLIASAADEALQALLPYRVGSLIDVAFNAVSACGTYLVLRYHGGSGAAHESEA